MTLHSSLQEVDELTPEENSSAALEVGLQGVGGISLGGLSGGISLGGRSLWLCWIFSLHPAAIKSRSFTPYPSELGQDPYPSLCTTVRHSLGGNLELKKLFEGTLYLSVFPKHQALPNQGFCLFYSGLKFRGLKLCLAALTRGAGYLLI